MPQPVPAQQTGPAMAVQPIPQTPQAAALEQEPHDANSVVTENAGSDPAPAEMLDHSWHPVAAQGDHAIFNDGGIFYGTELKKRTTKNGRSMRRIFISPTLKHLCIPADRHGHNDLDVGVFTAPEAQIILSKRFEQETETEFLHLGRAVVCESDHCILPWRPRRIPTRDRRN